MEIRFSRHAKRRAKLYGITEATVEQIVAKANLVDGENEIIEIAPGFRFPLKIVAVLEDEVVTVVTSYPLKKESYQVKVHYDDEIDALYLGLSDLEPDGVIEIAAGVNLDMTEDGKLVGIEILKASTKFNIDTILSYTLELDKSILKTKAA